MCTKFQVSKFLFGIALAIYLFLGILLLQITSLDYEICIGGTSDLSCFSFLISQPNSILFSATDSLIISPFDCFNFFMLEILFVFLYCLFVLLYK